MYGGNLGSHTGRRQANVICVLHPLSYLIKPINFERLRRFKDRYVLKKGMIFSSGLFAGTGGMKFPIIIALYEQSSEGMDWRYIQRFEFDVMDDPAKFVLANYQTTDGFINKYPPRKYDEKTSPIGLYYYTFRDFNSLRKNASFISEPHYNAVVVTNETFYHYAYLFTLKSLFQHENEWLFGNISPLINRERVESIKGLFVRYALAKHPLFRKLDSRTINKIREFYSLNDGHENIDAIEEVLRAEIWDVFRPRPQFAERTKLFSRPRQPQVTLPF